MSVQKLTQQLINIPSYVNEDVNEKKIQDFLSTYVRDKFPWLSVTKQIVEGERYNLILSDGNIEDTRMLVVGHVDTVQPQTAWKTDPLKAVVADRKIVGLGATDMKGNLAALLSAIETIGVTNGVTYVLYIDEEYFFKGMKAFITEYASRLRPDIIWSVDGDELQYGYGCRGIIEVSFDVIGKSGHAALPSSGVNAIQALTTILASLEKYLRTFKTADLGKTTINIASIQGGTRTQDGFATQGNIIPDFAQALIDIRVADTRLTSQKVINYIQSCAQQQNVTVENVTISIDYGSWLTSKNDLSAFTSVFDKPTFIKPADRGYNDIQMLWKAFGVPCFSLGAGETAMAHKPDEYVVTENLQKAQTIYSRFLDTYKI